MFFDEYKMYNEIQIFCNTINNFPVTFDHFNASLPNKEFFFTDPKFLNGRLFNIYNAALSIVIYYSINYHCQKRLKKNIKYHDRKILNIY